MIIFRFVSMLQHTEQQKQQNKQTNKHSSSSHPSDVRPQVEESRHSEATQSGVRAAAARRATQPHSVRGARRIVSLTQASATHGLRQQQATINAASENRKQKPGNKKTEERGREGEKRAWNKKTHNRCNNVHVSETQKLSARSSFPLWFLCGSLKSIRSACSACAVAFVCLFFYGCPGSGVVVGRFDAAYSIYSFFFFC